MIGPTLKMQLRMRVRSGTYTDPPRPSAAGIHRRPRHRPRPDQREFRQRLRSDRPGRRDARQAPRPGHGRPPLPGQTLPETDGPRPSGTPTARPSASSWTPPRQYRPVRHRRSRRRTRSPIREVQRYGQTLPEGSYGRRNRQAFAARETRVAARLRAGERLPDASSATSRPGRPSPVEPVTFLGARPTGRWSRSRPPKRTSQSPSTCRSRNRSRPSRCGRSASWRRRRGRSRRHDGWCGRSGAPTINEDFTHSACKMHTKVSRWHEQEEESRARIHRASDQSARGRAASCR